MTDLKTEAERKSEAEKKAKAYADKKANADKKRAAKKVVHAQNKDTIRIKHRGVGNPLVIGRRLLKKGASMDITKKDLEHFLISEAAKVVFDKFIEIVKHKGSEKKSSDIAASLIKQASKKEKSILNEDDPLSVGPDDIEPI